MHVIRNWKRQRAANKVVDLGEAARDIQRTLTNMDRDDEYFDYLVQQKRQLDARRNALLTYLKETA